MSKDAFLRMENIRKEFPGVVANDDVDLSVQNGEIHGLLGENGAGKSTLMKILYGLYTPDRGEIVLKGESQQFASPQDAIDAGIGMVHQHFKLIPRLTVAENIVLGMREPATVFREDRNDGPLSAITSNRFVQGMAARFTLGLDVPEQEIQTLADEYGFDIDVSAPVWELDIGQQQRVEILKALYRDVDLLILDEPTAVLTPEEAEKLFVTLKRLTEEGLSIIAITHKLHEIKSVTDRVTVLRDGAKVGTVVTDEMSRAELAKMMVGRDVLFELDETDAAIGDPILEVRNLTAENDRGIEMLHGVDLTLREGEIVGIAGVSGNGQKELAQAIAGVRPMIEGTVAVRGTDLTGQSTREFIDNGVSFVPEDRYQNGSAGDLPILYTAAMKQFREFSDGIRCDYNELQQYAEALVDGFDVRGVDDVTATKAKELSGGNLQKLILSRELDRDPDVLVANQPTRGVDVGAIEFIREQLLEQREHDTGIVLLSEDMDELFDLSDRILVIYEGEIVHETTPENADRERISLEMNGGSSSSDQTQVATTATGSDD